MKIIGCDFHPGYQQIAVLDLATGEMVEKALSHERKEEVHTLHEFEFTVARPQSTSRRRQMPARQRRPRQTAADWQAATPGRARSAGRE